MPVIDKVKVAINHVAVPYTWSNPDLTRMANLNLRLSPRKFRQHPDLYNDLFIKLSPADASKTAEGQSLRLGKDLARWPKPDSKIMIPIPLPVFPLGGIPLVDMLNGRNSAPVNKYFPGGGGNEIEVIMDLNDNTYLEQYISHLNKTIAGDGDKIVIDWAVRDYYGFVETISFTKDQKFLTEFSFHQKKNPLEFPFVTWTPKIFTIEAGSDRKDNLDIDLGKFQSRFLICFFTKIQDDGTQYSAVNRDKFFFPTTLKSFDCQVDGRSIMNGPVKNLGNRDPDPSKVAFYREQMKYRSFKQSFGDFFTGGCSDQFIVIDLTSLRVSAISRGTNIPKALFSLEWSRTTGQTRYLHVYSVTEHMMKLGSKSSDVTFT